MRFALPVLLAATFSACTTHRVTNYPSHSELNQAAIAAGAQKAAGLDSAKGRTVAIIPASGLHGDNLYPQQIIEHFLANALIEAGMRPLERNADLIKALALNSGGFQGGVFPYLSGKGETTYEADLLAGAKEQPLKITDAPQNGEVTKDNTVVVKLDEQVLRFLANHGVTKTFDFPQPDYFLSYDVGEAGVRIAEFDDPNSSEPMVQRQARVRLLVKLIDARTAEIVNTRVLEASQEDVVPARALALLEKPHYKYYGPARYGSSETRAVPGTTEAAKGITSLRERVPFVPAKYATLSAGAISMKDYEPMLALRYDHDLSRHYGFMGGLSLASYEENLSTAAVSATTDVFFVNPQLAGKLMYPVSEHFVPYALAGPELKIVSGAEDVFVKAGLLFGAGAIFPITGQFVVRGDLMAHYSGDVEGVITDPTGLTPDVELTLLDGFQTEFSVGLGVRF